SAACGFLLGTFRFNATGTFELQWWEGILAGALALSAVAAHEVAHALVGALTGRRIERIEFGLKIGMVSAGDSTALRRAASIAAGPVAEIVVGPCSGVPPEEASGPS
ncbi:MAG: peptidase, partial [Arthrobacter sp.]|nr:peptidase [Arthrobacter sp.]